MVLSSDDVLDCIKGIEVHPDFICAVETTIDTSVDILVFPSLPYILRYLT